MPDLPNDMFVDSGELWYECGTGPMVLGEAPIYRALDDTLHVTTPFVYSSSSFSFIYVTFGHPNKFQLFPENSVPIPHMKTNTNFLEWVDALKEPPELHILHIDPETGLPKGEARVLVLEDSVTVHYFRKDVPGSYICAYYQGVAFLDEKTGKLEIVKEIIPKEERGDRRFNDGGVDAKGRFWLAEIDKKVSTTSTTFLYLETINQALR